jgi:membrane protease subunit HflK
MDFRDPYRRPGQGPSEAWQRYLPFFPWAIGGLVLIWLLSDFSYTVQPYEQAAILRFGRSYTTAQPGLHFKLPLIDQVMKVSVEEHGLRLPLGTASQAEESYTTSRASARQQEDDTLMLTGDLNTASVEWTVQWKVTDPAQFLFRFPLERNENFADELLTTVARTVMNRLVGDYSFDEVIGAKRSDIAFAARGDTQRILDSYACGITVTALQMQRVIPPDRVKPAFDKVNASIQEKQKLENEAEAARNKLIPEARASSDKLVREAEGYAGRRKAESTGEIDALLAKYHAYQRAPEITRQRLYLEAMQDVLQGVKNKLIIDSDLKQTLPFLNLDPKGEGR